MKKSHCERSWQLTLDIGDNGLMAFDSDSHGRSDAEARKQCKQPSAINKPEGTTLEESCSLHLDMYGILPSAYCNTNLHHFT